MSLEASARGREDSGFISVAPRSPKVAYRQRMAIVLLGTAVRLRAAGLNARCLRGGIDGWKAAGQPLAPRTEPS